MDLNGEMVSLRPFEAGDLEKELEWFEDPEVADLLEGESQESAPERLTRLFEAALTGTAVGFTVETKEGQVIGDLWIHPIDKKRRRGTLSILVGERSLWGKGFGKDAVRAVLPFLFNTLGLESLVAKAFAHNYRGNSLFRNLGFKVLDTRPEAVRFRGRLWDEVTYVMYARDFHKRTQGSESNR